MEVFTVKIRPALQKFLESPNINTLTTLHEQLQSLENSQLDTFQNYILVPLVTKIGKLTNPNDNAIQIQVIRTAGDLIHRIHVKDLNALKSIIIVLLQQLHNFHKGCLKENTSEELKLASIKCLTETLCRSTFEVLEQFYKEENCAILGKIAVTCIDIIQLEKYRLLRIAAIRCLESLFYVHDSADQEDIVLRSQVADVTFLFLPKIISVLLNLSIGDEKCGHTLISQSVSTLGKILGIIFQDNRICEEKLNYETKNFIELIQSSKLVSDGLKDDEILGSKIKKKECEDYFKKLQQNGRNAAWFGASSRKIKSVISKMAVLRSNESLKVRLEYAKMSCLLAVNCTTNLKENISIFLETIIAFSQDEDPDIQTLCKNTIASFQTSKSEFNLNTELELLFDRHLIRLPNIIHRCDESDQYAEFLFLKGFFNTLPTSNLQMILSVPGNLEKFTKCLIAAYDLELTTNLLQNEYALRIIDEDQTDNDMHKFSWKKFKNLTSIRVENVLNEICRLLGKSLIVELIFDQIFATMLKNRHVYNECALILMIMLTSKEHLDNEKLILLQNFLDEIMEEQHWHLALEPDEITNMKVEKNSDWFADSTPGLYESAVEIRTSDINPIDIKDTEVDWVRIHDAKFNILHTCLILEALGNVALLLNNKFKPYIFNTLHRILLKTGSTNYSVHKSGSFALHCVRKSLGFNKISELIQNYSDYVSYHINIALRKSAINSSSSAVDILIVVLRYSSLQSMSHLENIMLTILDELTKTSQTSNITAYLKVFDIFLQSVAKWRDDKQFELKEEHLDLETGLLKKSLYEMCIDILEKPLSEIDISDLKIDNESANETEDDKFASYEEEIPEPKLPKYIEIVFKILNEVLKFISSKNQIQKVVSLECLINGLPIISDYEKEFLPLVHLVWYPYAERFKDKDPIVLHRCFTLLEVLARNAKDFLMKRSLDDLFPFFNDFLKKSLANSLRDTNLTQTQELKLQTKLLGEYADLIMYMDVRQKPLDEISDTVLLYLNKRQPAILQESAVGYFKAISNYDRPLVYIKLMHYLDNINYSENICSVFKNIGIETS